MGRHYGLDFNLMAVSAASGAAPVAPESIASLYGSGFTGGFTGGSRVMVEDVEAEVFFVAAGQINFVLPAGTAPGVARVSVVGPDGVRTHSTTVSVRASAPAVFSANGSGQGAVAAFAFRVGSNGVRADVPVFRCSGPLLCVLQGVELEDGTVYLSIYGTGVRRARKVAVKIDQEAVPVVYAGPQGEFAGLDQVNVRLDRSVRTRGERNLTVFADGAASNVVRILLR
jgi:uncharacterized protein (TIGR03437 family)